ncbi:hypothetical protein BDV29DRAFT_163024 [Aspergillus leporis]|uniref:Uncharacterized protein n=1 Tax=Aspergillus leporis TaxID=41062 RepID=A0A5N5WH89_9EURO|nr:hypothetical protein BDV29DRAFT_163024 [Aspergillus leporis]
MYQREFTGYVKAVGPGPASTVLTAKNRENLCRAQIKLHNAEETRQEWETDSMRDNKFFHSSWIDFFQYTDPPFVEFREISYSSSPRATIKPDPSFRIPPLLTLISYIMLPQTHCQQETIPPLCIPPATAPFGPVSSPDKPSPKNGGLQRV